MPHLWKPPYKSHILRLHSFPKDSGEVTQQTSCDKLLNPGMPCADGVPGFDKAWELLGTQKSTTWTNPSSRFLKLSVFPFLSFQNVSFFFSPCERSRVIQTFRSQSPRPKSLSPEGLHASLPPTPE